jgi:hypothetical protein
MSIRPSESKYTTYSPSEPPPTDLELKIKEAKSILCLLLIFISIDYILTALIIINQCNIFKSKENNIPLLLIHLISITVCYLLIYISLYISLLLLKQNLTKIIRYVFLVVFTILYFLFEIFLTVTNFIDNYPDVNWVDILFMVLLILSIVPRILFFYYLGSLIIKINEGDDCKKGEEHEDLKKKLTNKMEREDSNWSKRSLNSEKKIKNNKNGSNNENIASIKENNIEEEED